MKENFGKITLIVFLFLITFAIIFPWGKYGIITFPDNMKNIKDFKLGLDLHGGVELDYKIDLDTAKKKAGYSEVNTTEGLKSIVEDRVNSLGTAEPTILTAKYGQEPHIIVQIPSQNYDGENLTETEITARNNEFIKNAKDKIGKVIRLEFKEKKTEITDADKTERKNIANDIKKELTGTMDFATVGNKYKDSYENIAYLAGSGTKNDMPQEATFKGMENVKTPYISDVIETAQNGTITVENAGNSTTGEKGYSIIKINSISKQEKEKEVSVGTGASATKKKEKYTDIVYDYQLIFVDQKPTQWTPAKTKAGEILDERYLIKATAIRPNGEPQIELTFNNDGKGIFKELTGRLIDKQLAIFVGGTLVTAPVVKSEIPSGKAVISGEDYTIDSVKQQANDINTGIVPAPIYLTSERAIDAKIGGDSLNVIIRAGIIGFLLILTFLVLVYRLSGLFAGIALLIYIMITMSIVKLSGVVLSLASIAGLILSVGLAIDANILIFERTKEEIRNKMSITKAINIGFDRSWTAIWDSHITQFLSAVILYFVGVNLIKGFGLMLGIGIVVSLFTAMWVSRVLIVTFAPSFEKNLKAFIGIKE